MDLLKKLCKYFIITLAILFVCSFVVLVDKFHKIEYDVFDVLETYKALKYFFILGASAFTASVAYSIGIAALFAFDKLKVQTWKKMARNGKSSRTAAQYAARLHVTTVMENSTVRIV